MDTYKCRLCGLTFEVKDEKDKDELKCPRCKSPNLAKLIDGLENLFNSDGCRIIKRSA